MSFVLQPWRLLVTILADWVNQRQQLAIEYLCTKNQVLKEMHGKKRILVNDDRRRLAVKSRLPWTAWLAILPVTAVICATSSPIAAQEVRYNRDVLPILAENCFTCHGFDKARREAGLRLDSAAGATAVLESGAGPSYRGRWRKVPSSSASSLPMPTISCRQRRRESI